VISAGSFALVRERSARELGVTPMGVEAAI
jgi:hypothetical protein